MRCCGDGLHGDRARAPVVVLWRAGLRLQEALDLNELDLDRRRGSVLVRRGTGGRRREVGMDNWGFEHHEPWASPETTARPDQKPPAAGPSPPPPCVTPRLSSRRRASLAARRTALSERAWLPPRRFPHRARIRCHGLRE